MPAITFFALLNDGYKLDVYEKKMLLTIAVYPNMDQDQQEALMNKLLLPDDVLGDMIDSETKDDINILKEALDGD